MRTASSTFRPSFHPPIFCPFAWLLGAIVAGLPITPVPAAASGTQASDGDAASLELAYTGDLATNLAGGHRVGTVGLGNLDAVVRIDAGALGAWNGLSVLLYGLANHGARPTDLTGDAQVASNIEAPNAVRLYEAWVQQNVRPVRLSLLVGLYDVNSEFDVLNGSALFLNSSFGIGAEFGASGLNGPSIFPVTSLGARLQWHPTREVYLQGAALDGVPGDPEDPTATRVRLSAGEGLLWVAEAGYIARPDGPGSADVHLGRHRAFPPVDWRVALGAWQYTRRAARLDGAGRQRARPGMYLLMEGRPYRETDPDQGAAAFVRLGVADGRTNRFAAFTGAGVTYRGVFPGRDQDVLGLGVAAAHNGEPFEEARRSRDVPVSARETVFELTYRIRASSRLSLQPDLQLILDPDTDPGLRPALLASVRASLTF